MNKIKQTQITVPKINALFNNHPIQYNNLSRYLEVYNFGCWHMKSVVKGRLPSTIIFYHQQSTSIRLYTYI